MKRMIFSLLLLSGVVAKAQSKWPTVQCGDTTYYLLKDEDVGDGDYFEFTEGMPPMGLGIFQGRLYSFRHKRGEGDTWEPGTVYGFPIDNKRPQIGISYPWENHEFSTDYRNHPLFKLTQERKEKRRQFVANGNLYDDTTEINKYFNDTNYTSHQNEAVTDVESKWASITCGDTTYTLISDYSVIKDFRVENTWVSFDVGFGYDTMVYEFFIFEEKGIMIGAPHNANCAMMEYPIENHEEKYWDYVDSNWYLRKMERINRGRKRDGLKPVKTYTRTGWR